MAQNFGDMLVAALRKTKSATPAGKAHDATGNGGPGGTASAAVQSQTRMGHKKGEAKTPPHHRSSPANKPPLHGVPSHEVLPPGVADAMRLRKGNT